MNPTERIITWEELGQHTTRQSLWVLIEGNVYDVTTYLAEHPGGDDILIKYAGTNATEKFLQINHTPYARSLRDARIVGTITKDPQPQDYLDKIKKSKQINANPNRLYTWEEVMAHNTKDDLWVVVQGKVYDVSDFQNIHPGGPAVLLARGGDDASSQFADVNHSRSARDQMSKYQVGVVSGNRPKVGEEPSNVFIVTSFMIVVVLIFGLIFYLK